MNVEIFIVSIGLGVLGFALGFAKGSEVMVRHIRESFLETKEFLDNKQEEHFKQFGVYADVNSKLAEWMQEYKDKQL